MRAIFISYRREDAEGQAGRLFQDLARHFGEQAVFMDVAAIEPGRDFRKAIDEHVASCGVLLAVIGKGWTDATDESGNRRLDDPLDFVRLETASALKRDIPVVPVLVHGARMPRAEQLPTDLSELAFRNAIELTHARWESDLSVLVKALSPYVTPASPRPPERQTAGTDKTAVERRGSKTGLLAAAIVLVVALGAGAYFLKDRNGGGKYETVAEQAAPLPQPEPVAESATSEAAQQTFDSVMPSSQQKSASPADAPSAGFEQPSIAVEAPGDASVDAVGTESDEPAEAVEVQAVMAAEPSEAQPEPDEAVEMPVTTSTMSAGAEAGWHDASFPAPNAGALAVKTMPDGNPACASYDQQSCLWGVAVSDLDLEKLKPLECGEMHQSIWGVTGYEDPKHWCSLARRAGATAD